MNEEFKKIERHVSAGLRTIGSESSEKVELHYNKFVNKLMEYGGTIKGCQHSINEKGVFIFIYYEIPKKAIEAYKKDTGESYI